MALQRFLRKDTSSFDSHRKWTRKQPRDLLQAQNRLTDRQTDRQTVRPFLEPQLRVYSNWWLWLAAFSSFLGLEFSCIQILSRLDNRNNILAQGFECYLCLTAYLFDRLSETINTRKMTNKTGISLILVGFLCTLLCIVSNVDAQLQDKLLWSDTDTKVNILRQHIHADKDQKWEQDLERLKQGIQMDNMHTQTKQQSSTSRSSPKYPQQTSRKLPGQRNDQNASETTLYVDMLNRLAKTGGNLVELVEGIRKAVELQGNQENLMKVDEAIDNLLTSLHNVPLSLSLPKVREIDIMTGMMERRLVDRLVKLIDSQKITSIVHVSCANQMHWMNNVLQMRPHLSYMGLDHRDATLVWLRSKYYGHPNIQFRTVEWKYMLPKGYQLLVAVNALSSLELQHVYTFFSAAKYAGFEYFLISSYEGARNEEQNQTKMLDFRKPPFGFKKPVRVFREMGTLKGKPITLLMYSKEALEQFGKKDMTVTFEEL